MNILEMLEKVKENPNKKFANSRASEGSYVALDEDKTLSWFGEGQRGQPFLVNFLKDDEWEEVKEPVTFMEAVESKKTFTVKHGHINGDLKYMETECMDLDSFLYELSKELGADDVAEILLSGKFYIED